MDVHDAPTRINKREDSGMHYISDTYATDASRGGRDAHRITIGEALYWWDRGLATPVSGDDMYRPKGNGRD